VRAAVINFRAMRDFLSAIAAERFALNVCRSVLPISSMEERRLISDNGARVTVALRFMVRLMKLSAV
jgi:hypothetical protein